MTQHSFLELRGILLKARGIDPKGEESFLNPDYTKLHDPFLLPDMEKACNRVIDAMKKEEHIVVFSDYDADGIPGAVVLNDFFRRAGYQNVSFYIPHRHDEGFGLNLEAIGECAERGAKLIVTVDCGVADYKEVELANEKGMEVIITDHHEPPEKMPRAYAVVNPKRADSIYPFKELCGSGVAFKLIQAILAKESFGIKPGMEKWSLDMVGIATLSDMVPLVDENRIFAKFGLDVLRKSPRPGLAALFKKLGIERKNVSEDDVAFMITPRINAASRMGVPHDAFRLLSTEDPVEAETLAAHLEKINNERKGVVAAMVKDAKQHLAGRDSIPAVIVAGNPEWRPSLAGLVANSLVEEYERPAFVWGRDGDGKIKGSCRSYNGYNLFKLMEATSKSFDEYGGHAGAGGFSTTLKKLASLEASLSEAITALECEEDVSVEGIPLMVSDVGESLWGVVSLFAPFGTGNEKPVFKIQGKLKSFKTFGKESNHLEVVVEDVGRKVRAISFFSTPESYKLGSVESPCTLLGHLEKSYFRNRPEIRMRIVDVKH